MHTTVRLLDELGSKLGLRSDYAIAKHLGISTQRMSRYRCRLDALGPEMALRVADDLSMDRGYVLACIAAERAKRTDERKAWEALAKKAGIAATLLISLGIIAGLWDQAGAMTIAALCLPVTD